MADQLGYLASCLRYPLAIIRNIPLQKLMKIIVSLDLNLKIFYKKWVSL